MIARMRGQSLVLGMLLLAAGGVVWLHMYNGGQVVAARSQLTHAADAVAYSGALLDARTLNMHAYINRAQVAHQIAMGHLATMASWAQLGDAQAGQAMRGNPPAALIGMLFGPSHGTAYASARAALGLKVSTYETGVLAQAYAHHERTVHDVLAAASTALLAAMPRVRLEAMQQVLAANYRSPNQALASAQSILSRAGLSLQVDDRGSDAVVQNQVQPGQGLRALIDQAVAGYAFLGPRNHTARNPWIVSSRCPHLRHELRRRGQTRLGDDGTWQSGDSESFHALRSNRWIGCYYREYPMGWGLQYPDHVAKADGYDDVVDPPDDFSREAFWRWAQAHTGWDLLGGRSNPLADSRAAAGAVRWRTRGLPRYAALSARRADAGTVLNVVVRQRAASLSTTDAASRVRVGTGLFAYRGLSDDQAVTVTSAAQTYFVRPEGRADGRTELASLFHPYWQARLVASSRVLPAKR